MNKFKKFIIESGRKVRFETYAMGFNIIEFLKQRE